MKNIVFCRTLNLPFPIFWFEMYACYIFRNFLSSITFTDLNIRISYTVICKYIIIGYTLECHSERVVGIRISVHFGRSGFGFYHDLNLNNRSNFLRKFANKYEMLRKITPL